MKTKARGFTLLELMIVVSIIGVLASIAIPNFLGAQTRARHSAAIADLHTLRLAVAMYELDAREYPPNMEVAEQSGLALKVLLRPIPYLSVLPRDPFYARHERMEVEQMLFRYVNLVALDPDGYDLSRFGIFGSADFVLGSRGVSSQWDMAENLDGHWGMGFADSVVYDPTNGVRSAGNILVFGP